MFVPDDDVVGPVDGGWTVARATLGNESVSIGGGSGGMSLPGEASDRPLRRRIRSASPAARRASVATSPSTRRWRVLNLRSANRAVAGGGPGPEGNVTKLVLSEIGHEAAAILAELDGPDAAFLDGAGAMSRDAGAHAPRACRSPAARPRSSATRSASASSACPATR